MGEFTQMCCGECGIEFSVPTPFYTERLNEGGNWHCPNGHTRVFRESRVDKLRRERDRLQQQLAAKDDEILHRDKRIKKLEKRAAAGACPCCHRTFANMARHMKHQHPEFVADNVVKLKAKA